MMNKQEMFDAVWQEYIVNEAPPGIKKSNLSAEEYAPIYGDPEKGEPHCPIGFLFQEHYYPAMEGMSAKVIATNLELEDDLHVFLEQLQMCHDGVLHGGDPFERHMHPDFWDVKEFKKALITLGINHRLKVPGVPIRG